MTGEHEQPKPAVAQGREGAAQVDLGWRTLAALRLKHAWRLAHDVSAFSADQGAWWLIPAVAVVVAITVVASATSATVPYLVYTLF